MDRLDERQDRQEGLTGEEATDVATPQPPRQVHRVPDPAALLEHWDAALETELAEAVALRRRLHAAPEVSGAEYRTAQMAAEAIGGEAEPVAGTGLVLRIGPPGPAVAVRAELDALPVQERTGATFAATNGAMHACGHDVHLAAVVALARAARRVRLPYGLVVVLQPREEVGPTGANDVVASGVLERHDVRAIVGAHVQPLVPVGAVAADAGPVNAAVDEVEITVTGRGGHSAYPHLAVDPVPALCASLLAMQETVRSAVNPLHPVVLTLPQLWGAGAPNVVPETARAAGTLRTMYAADAHLLYERMTRTVEGVAAAHGCRGEFVVRRGEPALVNDPDIACEARAALQRLGVPTAPFASCGSDDFATYGLTLPTLMLFVGTGEGDAGPMLHDPRFLPADERVRDVARATLAGWLGAVEALPL